MYCQVRSCVRLRGENTKAVLKSLRKHFSLKIRVILKPVNFYCLNSEFDEIASFIQFFQAEKLLFFKYDEIIMMPRFVAEVWEVRFRENILSATIIVEPSSEKKPNDLK